MEKINLQIFPELPSTNDEIKKQGLAGAPEGTAVLAEKQSAGRGRLGNSFLSPEGGIYLSVLLRPACSAEETMPLTVLLAVAAVETIEEATGIRPKIKWPNDLVSGRKKLGGILTELTQYEGGYFLTAGIGLNCGDLSALTPEVRQMAASLSLDGDTRARLPEKLAENFLRASRALTEDRSVWMEKYRADCVTIGETAQISIEKGTRDAYIRDVDENGKLLAEIDGKICPVFLGEASLHNYYR